MSDSMPVVHGDSQEAVAYALALGVALHADKIAYCGATPVIKASLQWVAKTYSECLLVVQGPEVYADDN